MCPRQHRPDGVHTRVHVIAIIELKARSGDLAVANDHETSGYHMGRIKVDLKRVSTCL
jgi:hypothetical protein